MIAGREGRGSGHVPDTDAGQLPSGAAAPDAAADGAEERTPQRFYARMVVRPDVHALLTRLAATGSAMPAASLMPETDTAHETTEEAH